MAGIESREAPEKGLLEKVGLDEGMISLLKGRGMTIHDPEIINGEKKWFVSFEKPAIDPVYEGPDGKIIPITEGGHMDTKMEKVDVYMEKRMGGNVSVIITDGDDSVHIIRFKGTPPTDYPIFEMKLDQE